MEFPTVNGGGTRPEGPRAKMRQPCQLSWLASMGKTGEKGDEDFQIWQVATLFRKLAHNGYSLVTLLKMLPELCTLTGPSDKDDTGWQCQSRFCHEARF